MVELKKVRKWSSTPTMLRDLLDINWMDTLNTWVKSLHVNIMVVTGMGVLNVFKVTEKAQ